MKKKGFISNAREEEIKELIENLSDEKIVIKNWKDMVKIEVIISKIS